MARDTGWLLEHEDHRSGHRWLRAIKYSGDMKGAVEWTEDSNLALRFARRDDAVNFAWLFPEMCTLALITEHVWGSPALETISAQHDETGRMWEGPRDQLPPGYSAVKRNDGITVTDLRGVDPKPPY